MGKRARERVDDPKYREVRYTKEGERLVYIGNEQWVREVDLPTREEQERWISRYPRPRIYPLAVIGNILLPFLLASLIDLGVYYLAGVVDVLFYVYLDLIFLGSYLFFNLGHLAIFAIRLYQRFAPIEVRARCGYTPTCSEYTILAIEKYGFFIGLIVGLRRCFRCDGEEGEDYP